MLVPETNYDVLIKHCLEQGRIHSPGTLTVLDSYQQKAYSNCIPQNRRVSVCRFPTSVDNASARTTMGPWNVSLLSDYSGQLCF